MTEATPLSWVRDVGGGPDVVNTGDALSPLMVAMVSGRPVAPQPFETRRPRLSAIGTIAQKFRGGVVQVWGSGCEPQPRDASGAARPFAPAPDTRYDVRAARGPRTAALLGAEGPVPYGDPAELLPLFYRPGIEPKWELGVILHLSELTDRGLEARPHPDFLRYVVPEEMAGDVRLITMVAKASVAGVKGKIDEILSCRRILSTSLHGVSLAMAYGVPCAYFGAGRGAPGAVSRRLDDAAGHVNPRFIDLYAGYGAKRIAFVRQPRRKHSDWPNLFDAVDQAARLRKIDTDALLEAFPGGAAPLTAPEGAEIWDHPLIADAPIGPARGAFGKLAAALGR